MSIRPYTNALHLLFSGAFLLLTTACTSQADLASNYYDDGIYYDPTLSPEATSSPIATETTEQQSTAVQPSGEPYYEDDYNYYDPEDNSESNKQKASSGGTVINNYYGYSPTWGMPYYPYASPGWNIGFGWNSWGGSYWSMGYCWNCWGSPWYGSWGWYDPWYNPWNPWYGYGWGYPYGGWGGYWNGYWNGYYDAGLYSNRVRFGGTRPGTGSSGYGRGTSRPAVTGGKTNLAVNNVRRPDDNRTSRLERISNPQDFKKERSTTRTAVRSNTPATTPAVNRDRIERQSVRVAHPDRSGVNRQTPAARQITRPNGRNTENQYRPTPPERNSNIRRNTPAPTNRTPGRNASPTPRSSSPSYREGGSSPTRGGGGSTPSYNRSSPPSSGSSGGRGSYSAPSGGSRSGGAPSSSGRGRR